MRKLIFLAVLAGLAAAGCMQLEQDVTLNADGTSDVKLHYAVNQKQMAAMQGGAPGMRPGAGMPFDPQAFAKQMQGAKGTAPGTPGGPAAPPEKSIQEQVEEMKKAAKDNPDLKPGGPGGADDIRKQIEEMKKAAKDNPDLKPPTVQKPEVPKPPAKGVPAVPAGPGTVPGAPGGMEGVEIKDVRSETKGDWQHTYITAKCKNLGAVGTMGSGSGGPSDFTLVKNADGNYVLKMGGSKLSGMAAAGGDDDPQAAAQMGAMFKQMLAGFKMTVKYTLPGDIVESNADETDGRTVTWILDAEDANFMKKADKLGKQGMRVVFEGGGLKLPEFKGGGGK
ncbi:MAG: hypothetical protein ACYTGB_00320 [Planctomycetota bacterium]|jgi:hypothetical protein